MNAINDLNDHIQFFTGISHLSDKQSPVIGCREGGDPNTNMEDINLV